MADVSKIKLGSTTYDVKDATARSNISNLQTAINNIESITQTEIDEITDYTPDSFPAPVYGYDTVADMQADASLQEGMIVHTNGFHAAGDGGAAYYTVSTSGDIALQGGLYATKVAYKNPVPSSPKILAHRGISTISSWIYSIDNSLWSFMGAMANGFDGFECDVRKDANGVLVMIHDADVSSVSNSSGDISTLDYATVKYATRKTAVTTDTTLTTLDEAAQVAKAFNAFMFVNVKDTTISAQQVTAALLAQGLDYDNFGIFIDEDNSSWVANAFSVPRANIGYSTTSYTATATEMEQLKTMADTAGKPYAEIIVRTIYSQDVENIKHVGFKSCLDSLIRDNSIDCSMVDYSIDDGRRWNGEDDASANFKGRSIRTFVAQSSTYSTLNAYLTDAISSNLNHFFGRINGATLTAWVTAAGLTHVQGTNNGGHVCGVIDAEFASGFIHILRTRTFITFAYERSNDTLYVELISDGFYTGLSQAYLDNMLTDAKTSAHPTHYTGYLNSSNAQTILGVSSTWGCNVDITNSTVMQTMVAIPVNTSLKTIYVYKRSNVTDTPTIYTITGA